MGRMGTKDPPRASGQVHKLMAGDLGERFGAQVVQIQGAAEHRNERIRRCVSEERRPQRRRWAAWAPKIRRGPPDRCTSSWPETSARDLGPRWSRYKARPSTGTSASVDA